MRPLMRQTATALLCAGLAPAFAAGAQAGSRYGGGAPAHHSPAAWHPVSTWHGSSAYHPRPGGWAHGPGFGQARFAGWHRYHQNGAARALGFGARRNFGYGGRTGYGYGGGYGADYGADDGYGYGNAGYGADYGASEYAIGSNAPLPGQPLYNQPGYAPSSPSYSQTYVVPATVYQPVTRSYTVPVMTYQTVQRTEQVPVTVYRRYVKTCGCAYSPE